MPNSHPDRQQRAKDAAFPMLLEALRGILAYEDDLPGPDTYGAEVYAKARAAIAKAEA